MQFCKVLPFSSAVFALPNWNAFLKYSSPGGPGLFAKGTRPGQVGETVGRALCHPRDPPPLPAPGRICQGAERARKGQTERALGQESRRHPGPICKLMIPKCVPLQTPALGWVHTLSAHCLGCLEFSISNLTCPQTLIITPPLFISQILQPSKSCSGQMSRSHSGFPFFPSHPPNPRCPQPIYQHLL